MQRLKRLIIAAVGQLPEADRALFLEMDKRNKQGAELTPAMKTLIDKICDRIEMFEQQPVTKKTNVVSFQHFKENSKGLKRQASTPKTRQGFAEIVENYKETGKLPEVDMAKIRGQGEIYTQRRD